MREALVFLFLAICGSLAHVTKEETEKVFDTVLDLDHNGVIEFSDICKMGIMLNIIDDCDSASRETAEFMEALDFDRSGKVDYVEFLSAYSSINEPWKAGVQQVHLSLTTDPTEMVVMWVTRDPSASTVMYGPASQKHSFSADGNITTYNVGVDGWHGWIHTVKLTDLTPNTTYYYIAGAESYYWSNEFNFTTAPPLYSDGLYRFAILGDMGSIMPMGWAVSDQMTHDNRLEPLNMVLLVGDVAYAGIGLTSELEELWDIWEDQVEPLASIVPWMFSVGNHESFYNFTAYDTRFLMPGDETGGYRNFWWSITYGNVHFTSMSTEHDYSPSSEQYRWIEKDLAAAHANENIKWIIVGSHRPMYCSCVAEWEDHHPGALLQALIEPLIIKNEVDLWLAGHIHMYERMYPVNNGTVAATGRSFTNPTAPIHIVQATGGTFFENEGIVDPLPEWFNLGSELATNWCRSAVRKNIWGYGRMSVNSTYLHYEYLDAKTGNVLDYFDINKM